MNELNIRKTEVSELQFKTFKENKLVEGQSAQRVTEMSKAFFARWELLKGDFTRFDSDESSIYFWKSLLKQWVEPDSNAMALLIANDIKHPDKFFKTLLKYSDAQKDNKISTRMQELITQRQTFASAAVHSAQTQEALLKMLDNYTVFDDRLRRMCSIQKESPLVKQIDTRIKEKMVSILTKEFLMSMGSGILSKSWASDSAKPDLKPMDDGISPSDIASFLDLRSISQRGFACGIPKGTIPPRESLKKGNQASPKTDRGPAKAPFRSSPNPKASSSIMTSASDEPIGPNCNICRQRGATRPGGHTTAQHQDRPVKTGDPATPNSLKRPALTDPSKRPAKSVRFSISPEKKVR